ncbi:IucA/IucC family siderophore biosynthesis protein [Billgrantia diversa]|uniref:IucA/IucC family protein n=1 Tax=Halomonas sp. MCCC 1A13316 TaxID=2733487 RepID=UPI0018A64F41|nr:IucA/IucC family protein [Halomonas sp. MCCC 1A13316]QOR38447.1 IucA/IucC family siderophore biosynthesis protein [Halomonas sp. MCCC 1A13316]
MEATLRSPQTSVDLGQLPSSPEYWRVQQRVLRQFIQGLLFEAVLPVVEETSGPGEQCAFSLTGRDVQGREVSYTAWGARKASFGRIRLTTRPVQRRDANGHQHEATLAGFMAEVVGAVVPAERLPFLMEELQQTLLKDAQSRILSGMPTTPDLTWDHDAWEGWLQEGHPYHPSYKSRLGFTLDDNAVYGPEFRRDIRPVWLAVAREHSRVSLSASLSLAAFLREELGEATLARFRRLLVASARRPQEYVFLPVHPWQWSHVILPTFQAELADGRLCYLGIGDDAYLTQQSIRTLANASRPRRANLKLALSIVNTSTSRILAAHTVENSARISDWLHDLVTRDEAARECGVVILREVLGVAYDASRLAEPQRSLAYGTLGAVWRESLHRYLHPDERALAFNGLTQLAATGVPMLDGWVRQHGVAAWTRRLLEVTVTPLIHLLFAHGIGLESHGQNILLIHRDGWPERIALKDFHDGVRYSPALLAEPARAPSLVPEPASHAAVNRNSYIQTESADEVRDFTYDAFVFIALTELCLCLEQHYDLSEASFWSMTAKVIRDYQAAHPELEPRFALFDLFAPTVSIEELTKRRLFGDTEKRFAIRDNPLHPHRPGA